MSWQTPKLGFSVEPLSAHKESLSRTRTPKHLVYRAATRILIVPAPVLRRRSASRCPAVQVQSPGGGILLPPSVFENKSILYNIGRVGLYYNYSKPGSPPGSEAPQRQSLCELWTAAHPHLNLNTAWKKALASRLSYDSKVNGCVPSHASNEDPMPLEAPRALCLPTVLQPGSQPWSQTKNGRSAMWQVCELCGTVLKQLLGRNHIESG